MFDVALTYSTSGAVLEAGRRVMCPGAKVHRTRGCFRVPKACGGMAVSYPQNVGVCTYHAM